MAETNNSFSTILAEFVRLQNNALEIITKQSQAVTTDADVVQVTTTNADGSSSTYTIPSFSGIRGSINRIDNTLTTLMGFDSDAYVRMPDGTFKRIYQTKTPVDPPRIGSLPVPSKFTPENNWFFESLMTPALKVSFKVTKYVSQQESKIGVKRLIINTDTEDKVTYFDSNIKGRNDIDYVDFLIELQKLNYTYYVDEDIIDLPLSVVRYSGEFTVVSFRDQKVTLQDGTEVTKRRYLFSNLRYTDNLSIQQNTMTLKAGDQLIKGETIYEVTDVNSETLYVGIKRLRGYEPLVAGESISLYSPIFSPKVANVGVGFDERQVVFFKNVNDEDNLISTKYSPGVAFYSNDLSVDLAEGTVSLVDYYQTRVMDFGSQLLAATKNNTISPLDGITPAAPELNSTNFKVVQINEHKLDQAQIVSIRKKAADKVRIEALIDQLQSSIDKKTQQLNTTNFASETDRRGVKNELETLIREKNSQSSLYASIVNELAATSQDAPAALDTPKYRVRGFFDVPTPKYSDKTGFQNVIQFYVYYRYVNPAGNASDTKQFDIESATGKTIRASFSNWQQVKSEIRTKSYNTTVGKYVWDSEDIENPDTINVNQVDIPISKGEKVEFYVVSVSEAGWPVTPLLSVPSNIVTIEFPQDLTGEDEALLALEQARQEAVKVQLESDLAAKGLDVHLSSSFNAGEQYYAHSADVISSSFYDSSGVVISLYEKLKSLDIAIQEIQNKISQAKGELHVFVIDKDASSKTEIQNGSTIKLFAGYYTDYVALLPASSQRGAIINKVYILSLENPIAATLELVSRFPGGIGQDLPDSGLTTTFNDYDYIYARKYDLVPIVNTTIARADTNNANKFSSAFYQSGQLRSQYLYSRYTDIGLATPLYVDPDRDADRRLLPNINGAAPIQSYVWNGSYNDGAPQGGGQINDFCVHIQHPALATGTLPTPLQSPQIFSTTVDGYPTSAESVSAFRHAYNFNTTSDDVRQLQYKNNWYANSTATPPGTIPPIPPNPVFTPAVNLLPDKFGFIDGDRYLIGKNTCGSYLLLAPATFDQLLVDGTDYRAVKDLGTGEANAIQIPIIYQFRMTDYAGDNTGTGTGYVGGYDSSAGWTPPTQLNYSKKIGIDIYVKETTVFSFDVQVSATYKRQSTAQRVDELQTSLVKTKENITYDKNSIKTLTR
jgi:hypothetical protein